MADFQTVMLTNTQTGTQKERYNNWINLLKTKLGEIGREPAVPGRNKDDEPPYFDVIDLPEGTNREFLVRFYPEDYTTADNLKVGLDLETDYISFEGIKFFDGFTVGTSSNITIDNLYDFPVPSRQIYHYRGGVPSIGSITKGYNTTFKSSNTFSPDNNTNVNSDYIIKRDYGTNGATIPNTNGIFKGSLGYQYSYTGDNGNIEFALWLRGFFSQQNIGAYGTPDILTVRVTDIDNYQYIGDNNNNYDTNKEYTALCVFDDMTNPKKMNYLILDPDKTSIWQSTVELQNPRFKLITQDKETIVPFIFHDSKFIAKNLYYFSNVRQLPAGTIVTDSAKQYRVISQGSNGENLLWDLGPLKSD